MGNEIICYQWPIAEYTFFDRHPSFSLVNECSMHLLIGVNKTPQFLHFSTANGGTKIIADMSIVEG
jgi:hypothetical protein